MPSTTDVLLLAPALLGQALLYFGTLFFFQLSRREIYDWVAKHLAQSTQRGNTALRLRAAENRVSRYFLTISVINAGLGLIVAAAMQLIGMPNAALWGVIAFLINYILYLGPAMLAVALVFAGIAAFDGLRVLLPALVYLGLNSTEGQFITPTLVGKHMQINPLLIFLSLTFGIWLWGPLGGVVAIPLLLWALVLTDSLPERRPASES
jgi:predicted PurR-regulated permease PerM